MSPVELLRHVIECSGLSARVFARDVLIRDERTIRRWLAGDSPIPESVVHFLEKQDEADHEMQRASIHHVDGNPRNNELSNLTIKRRAK